MGDDPKNFRRGIVAACYCSVKTFVGWSTKLLTVCWMVAMVWTASEIYAAPKAKIPPKTVYIEVVSVDPTAMTITVQPKNSMSTEAKTYKITPSTTVKVNGNPATLTDLKPDMQIHFTLAADGVTATELSASRAPAGSE